VQSTSKALDTSVPVVVLKVHHGSLGIARSLGRLGVAVHALAASRSAPAALSRYWRSCHEWDIDSASPQQSLAYLLDLGAQLGRRAILIPVSDHTTLFVAEHAQALRQHYLFPDLGAALVRTLASKKEMYFLAKRLGIATAETAFPQSRQDVLAYLRNARFPVMVKGIDGARLQARTGCKMAIARSEAELLEHYDRMEDLNDPNLMLQEYIPGGDDTIWMFNGYFNARSQCLAAFTGKKIRQNPVHVGSTSLGICLPNEEVERTTRALMKAVGYSGILDIGYRYDARDGKYKILDINPRIGSTFRLFVDDKGLDVVRALYRDLTGQAVPPVGASEGRKWIVEDQDLASCYEYARHGELSFGDWLVSLRGVREGAWFAADDLRPFFAIARALVDLAQRKAHRRFARRVTSRPRAIAAP
jgi:D-aspartate ligase